MKQQGIENLRAIFRRSRLIVLLLIVLGAIQMNIVRSQQGPLYSANANVILSPTDLATALSGLSSYVDPSRVDQTESALANSRQLFDYAAKKTPGVGTGSDLQSAVSVSKSSTTISFSATRSNAAAAVADANAVANAYPTWRASVSNASVDAAMAQLRAQIKRSGSDADTVSQLNKLRLLKTLTSGNVLLVERARHSVKTRPRPVRDTLLGAFVGLFAALVVVGLREALDTRVRSEYEVEELLGIPVLGSVERLPRRATPLVLGNREYERYSDMYALIAASVVRLREGADRTVIAITSATAGEGKTTTAVNLATALARRNENVCLIDLDTRRPSVARVLRIPRDAHGVDRALLRDANVGALLWDVSSNGSGLDARPAASPGARTATVHSRLQVLPMGSDAIGSISPHGDRLATLVRNVSDRSEFVVIDTPPALSVPDMTELAKLADIVLVVVRHGQASRRNLDALRRLHRTWPDVDIRGVVVDTPPDGDSYSYYAGS
jgi:Mrp family chromosome partitioning ATPase/capsular polysaccharide biosynthesis protein